MNTMNKFTATLVTEASKQAIVTLRNDTGLSEKDLMTIVIDMALQHRDAIVSQAREIVSLNEQLRKARKAEAYETLKAKMKQARDEIRQAKQALKEKQEAEAKAEADKKPSKKKKTEAVEA
jgi:hypothetical protein